MLVVRVWGQEKWEDDGQSDDGTKYTFKVKIKIHENRKRRSPKLLCGISCFFQINSTHQ
jgi:hypothetical protein